MKGLENNETGLFIRDILRIVSDRPELNIESIRGQMCLLGWYDHTIDDWTIQLIQVCYQDNQQNIKYRKARI